MAGTDLRRAWDLLMVLTVARIREERELTPLGILKWSMEPASYAAVYVLLFGVLLQRNRFAFPVFLLTALIPFRYLTGVLMSSMSVVRAHTSLVTHHVFPLRVLPLVSMLTELPNFLLSLLLVVPVMLYFGIVPGPEVVLVVPAIALMVLIGAGPAYILATMGLRFPGLRGLVGNLIRISFFASSALVPLEDVGNPTIRLLLRANPMTGLFEAFRDALLRGEAPGLVDIAYPLVFGVVALWIGLRLYGAHERHFAKVV
jgi:ABC-type polysaccharide/polyol phosphate export permease